MNIERSIGRHRIGDWEFSPATGELRRRTDLRRLEPRAAGRSKCCARRAATSSARSS